MFSLYIENIKDFDYLDGRYTQTEYHESANTDSTSFDLPRKTGATGTATTKENVNGSIGWVRTFKGDVDVLDLKARYLKYMDLIFLQKY